MPLSATRTALGGSFSASFQGSVEANLEGLQVAVVDAISVASQCPRTSFASSVVWDFAENIEPVFMGDDGEVVKEAVAERARDKEDGVSAMGAGFGDLVLVDDEVFAKAGDFGGGGGDFEVLGGCPGKRARR